jgi:two-component system sensor histidine kinase KdpD
VPAQSRRSGRLESRDRRAAGFTEAERAAADWAWQHDQPAGMGTGTLPFGRWWWWPLSVEDGPLALLGVCAKEGQTLSGQRRRLLTALSQPLAQALARASWPTIWKPRACTAKPSNCAAPCWPRCPTICARR